MKKTSVKIAKKILAQAKPKALASTKGKKLNVKRARKPVAKPVPGSSDPYAIELVLGAVTLSVKGETPMECIEQLNPVAMKTKGVFTISRGEKVKVIIMRPFQIQQTLKNQLTKEMFEKRILSILK